MKRDEAREAEGLVRTIRDFGGICFAREIRRTVLLGSVALVLSAGVGRSAVSIQSSYDNNVQALAPTNDGLGNYSYTFTNLAFSAAGTGKLVLGYGSRYAGNVGALPTSITYGGAALVEADKRASSRGTTGIWYLDGVVTDGDLVINFGTDGNTAVVGFSLFALDGLVIGDPTDGGTSGSGATPPEVILGADGGFAVSTAVRNNQSLSGDPDYTVDYYYSAGSDKLLSQHVVASAGGDYTASAGNANSMSITAFGWDAVSPPRGSSLFVR